MKRLLLVLVLALSAPALAQSTPASANPGVSALRDMWEGQSGYLLRAAEQMPDSGYAFKPVATLMRLNNITDPRTLRVGQVLKLP